MPFKKKYERYGLALRMQCVTFLDTGILINTICHKFLVTKSSLYCQKRIAKARGYDLDVSPILLDYYLDDAPRSGRPTLQTWERTRKMIAEVIRSKEGRNVTYRSLTSKLSVSVTTAYQMLKKEKFKPCKEFTKPRLTNIIKEA